MDKWISGNRFPAASIKWSRRHRFRPATRLEDEPGGGPGGPAGRHQEAAVGEGGGEGEGGQGGGLARLHHRQEHRPQGQILGLLVPRITAKEINIIQPVQ